MGKTRNERRKAAQARLKAKSERIVRADMARQADQRTAILRDNLSKPLRRRDDGYHLDETGCVVGGYGYYADHSNISRFTGESHRGHVCRAGGSMNRRSALALKMKGSY